MTPPVPANGREGGALSPPTIEHHEPFGAIVKKLSV